jgi:hypothetical protein
MPIKREIDHVCGQCGGVSKITLATLKAWLRSITRRSTPQHRRYMALIRAAYHHWPESHEFQPESETHLRKWLQVEAGYREFTDIAVPFAEDQPAVTKLVSIAIEAAIRVAQMDKNGKPTDFAFVRPHPRGGMCRVYRSKSIDYDTLGHLEACALFNAVAEIIESIIGRPADEILKQTEQAA